MRRNRPLSFPLLALAMLLLLTPRILLAEVMLNEFMAANTRTLADEEGDFSDWIELHNSGPETVDLAEWSLSTKPGVGRERRWFFPSTNLASGDFLVVFASGKNRRQSGSPLHTNFKLSRNGEPLLLFNPSEAVASGSFATPFPPQLDDVSYGLGRSSVDEILIDGNAPHVSYVPQDSTLEGTWTQPDYQTVGWEPGVGGIGYDTRIANDLTYHSWITDNCRSRLYARNPGLYLRVPFVVPQPGALEELTLQLWFTDGYVAWVNGVEVASFHRPADLRWNSASAGSRDPGAALRPVLVSLGAETLARLRPGTNWLAVQGLSREAAAAQFLILARLIGSRSEASTDRPRYFTIPSPAGPNGLGSLTLGPALSELSRPPATVEPQQPVLVTVKASPLFQAVRSVELRYRVMFGPEQSLPMKDDGLSGDGQARDGVYGATIPGGRVFPGQMLRWYVAALDTEGRSSRLPAWQEPNNSAAYVGTIGETNVLSLLPVFHWFIEGRDIDAAATRGGTRCSVHYRGEFYDNVAVRVRGENSISWDKKSYKFDFNPDQRFRFDPAQAQVDEINLNSTWSDKSYIRQVLSWEMYRDAGAAGCRSFPLRIQQNGSFHSVAVFVEQPDATMLRRNGLSSEGSLYKINNALESTQGAEKLLPRDGRFEELQEFVDGISASNPAQVPYLFDHLDLPALVNYLAATVLIHDNDCTAKNYFLYRDTAGSGEWQMLPWDKDLTFGRNFRSRAGLSDEIWADFDHTNSIGSDHPFSSPSHPLFMDQRHQKENGQWNRLVDALYSIPSVREMYLRRLRTLMDDLLQPDETPFYELKLERRLDELLHWVEPDTVLDHALWGYPTYGVPQTMGMAVQILQTEYLTPRRRHLFVTHNVTNSASLSDSARIPESQPPESLVQFGFIERSPLTGNPEEQYVEIINPNSFAVDLSGWRVDGQIRHVFKPGTVVPSSGLLILTPNRRAFRARSLSPRGGMGLLVQGDYQGRLGSLPGQIRVLDGARVAASAGLSDIRSPRQRHLSLARVMYQPAVLREGRCEPEEDLEYVELRNTGPEPLDLRGVRFTEGIHFDFGQSRLQLLPSPPDLNHPSRSLFLVKNRARFVAHYGIDDRIAGEYAGSLDNQGERLRLEEPNGEPLFDFHYSPKWQPVTQGLGFALARAPDAASLTGSPTAAEAWIVGPWEGMPGPVPPVAGALTVSPVLINEIVAAPADAEVDAIELVGAEGTDLGGWYLSDEFHYPMKFQIPPGSRISRGGFWVVDARSFGVPINGFPGFRLNRAGESVHLFSADRDGRLNGYYQGIRFPSTAFGTSYGRLAGSIPGLEEQWVVSPAPTLGTTNWSSRPGAVVFSEIMYRVADQPQGVDHPELDYLGLRNTLGRPILAFDPLTPTNTWRVSGVVDYRFPPLFSFPPASELLVVGFDPVRQPDLLERFRRFHGFSTSVRVLGPWRGEMANEGGRLILSRPLGTGRDPELEATEDEAVYSPAPPWDRWADGEGPSLSRKDLSASGTDPANWVATASNPGLGYDPELVPSILIHPADRAVDGYSEVTLGVLAGPDPSLRYQWRRNGRPVEGANQSVLHLRQPAPSESGDYDVLVMGRGGVVLSAPGHVEIRQPPLIYSHPSPPAVPVLGSNYVLRVGVIPQVASLRYQWLFNHIALVGETSPELRLNRLSFDMAGAYSVMVSDGRAAVESRSARIEPLRPPQILRNPESQMVNIGERIFLKVQAVGTEPLVYFWRKNGNYLKGEYRSELIIPHAALTNAGVYSVVVSNITTPRLIPPLERANVLVLGDTDGDGMPDVWELTYQFRFDQPQDAMEDADGDGMTNLEEYLAGTNPRNPQDTLRIDPLEHDARLAISPAALLGFNSISNRAYVIQIADRFGSPWSNWMRFPSLTTNSRVSVVVPLTPASQRHFRLLVPRVGEGE